MESGKKPNPWWFWVAGFFAFLWLLARSGTNPRRLLYPCQQAAFPLASGWLAMLALTGGGILIKRFARISGLAAVLVLASLLGASPGLARQQIIPGSLPVWEVENPVSTVFVMDSVPPTSGSLASGDASVPDEYLSDPAMDTLKMMLEAKGIHLYRVADHPGGIVGADNVVLIKGNFQWSAQNGTNSDRIKGLIWQILNHPDGFTGEIIVCDNTQDIGTGINEADNNADDPEQSVPDVIKTFQAKGYPVYFLDWNYIWDEVALEYSNGDYYDGYVYENQTKISYPKFKTPSGNYYVSLRQGVWDSLASSYDSSKLCIINFPVLKAHSLAGATIAIKNWIGVLTTAYSQERFGGSMPMHYNFFFSDYALVARVMAVTYPRLTIIDATWTSGEGPNNLAYLTNTKMLVASTDPSASSWYAAKFILTPVAKDPNETNPDFEGGVYHNHLSRWTTFLRDSASFPCTVDSAEISVYDRNVLEPVSVDEEKGLQQRLNLDVSPLQTGTWEINYSLPVNAKTRLVILDSSGRTVRTLLDEFMRTGTYTARWDGRDELGRNLSAGSYICLVQAGTYSEARTVIQIK